MSETALTTTTDKRDQIQMDVTRRSLRGAGLLLALVTMVACSSDSGSPPAQVRDETHTVTGHITEIEDHNLSLRVEDGRQLIFRLDGFEDRKPALEERMNRLQPITITYRIDAGKLTPLTMSDADATSPTPSE